MRGRGRWVWKAGAFLVFAMAVLTVLSWVVMTLWNLLIPSLFRGPAVGFWQAAGLLVLSRILFGGFRGHGHHRDRWKHRMVRARWESMTPEERQRLREKLGRFGGRCWGDEARGTGGIAPDTQAPPPGG